MPPRRRHTVGIFVLLLVAAGGIFLAFRQGLVPARWSPLPLLSLERPAGIFVDWQLAELRNEPELCRIVLRGPVIDAAPVPDQPIKNGCGWANSVRLAKSGGARIPVDTVTCPVAAALTLWIEHEVQPLALALLGQRVTAVHQLGTYSCRNIIGSNFWRDVRSEHATANAIDIASFGLSDGRRISVEKDWRGTGPESAFLKAVHDRACRYFRVTLGPDFNAAHHDHFHLDRGVLSTCG